MSFSFLQDKEIEGSEKINWRAGENFLIFHLRPAQKIGYDRSDIEAKWELMVGKVQKRTLASTSEENSLAKIKDSLKDFVDPKRFSPESSDVVSNVQSLDAVLDHQSNEDENFEIVFLGTGASLPSKYRNVSSTLVNIR